MNTPQRHAVLAIVSAGAVLATLDQFIANVALPSIQHALHGSVPMLAWVLNGYSIVFAALLVPAGRIADRNGSKGIFLVGVALFTSASAACAGAATLGELIAARALQAAGAALLVPSSLGVLLATYPANRRARAVRAATAVAGASAALGPVVGGLLVTAGWRWIFLVNVPVGIVTLALCARLVPRVPAEHGALPDLPGAALLASAIGALSLATVQGASWGWGSSRTVGTFVASAILTGAFLRRSRRHPLPVVELPLLRIRRFGAATTSTVLHSAAFGAGLLTLTLWVQVGWKWSALRFGLAFAPGPLMVPLAAPLTSRLIRMLGPGPTAALGSALFAASAILRVVLIGRGPAYVSALLPVVLLSGIGVALALPTLIATGSTTLPSQRFATGTGILNMGRQLGFTIGVAIGAAVLGEAQPHRLLSAFQAASLASAAAAALAAASSIRLGGSGAAGLQATLASPGRALAPLGEEIG
jgi:EmrB/QacA subfamily drug resistance transporter